MGGQVQAPTHGAAARPKPAAGPRPLTVTALKGHAGTGPQNPGHQQVEPGSVESQWLLKFVPPPDGVAVDVWLFEVNRAVPDWVGVAVPTPGPEFTRPHVFFHPQPGQPGAPVDADYNGKGGLWANVVGYLPRMGYQLAVSRRKQVLVMPFLTAAAAENLGSFAAEWHPLVSEILAQLKQHYAAGSAAPAITDLVASSFSNGVKFLHTFLHKGARVKEFIREAYDFDGRFSQSRAFSEGLKVTRGMFVLNYDQAAVTVSGRDARTDRARPGALPEGRMSLSPLVEQVARAARLGQGFHVPLLWWEQFTPRPTTKLELHSEIPRYLLRHALTKSRVGAGGP
jgi:hypothetical protein